MKYECCSKDLVIFGITDWLDLKKSEELQITITKCPVLKGTFDLNIIKQKKGKN
jgi:hypothetical protein